jgi:putative transposase
MKRRFTEEQIAYALKRHESGTAAAEICRELGVSEASFYKWKAKYAGMGLTELRKLKAMEEENRQLKKLVADLSLDKQILQDVLSKKL